jgi:hypothetical protein
MTDELEAVFDELHAALVARDADRVDLAIIQLEFFIVEEDAWSAELFDGVKPLWRNTGFLAIPTSYRLARLVAENWEALSAAQRADLRPLLAEAFDKFGDSTGAFVIAEVFGDRYADDAAFATLNQLSSDAATTPSRALATYGLGRLARTVGEGPLYSRAVERLKILATSVTPEIEEEAQAALQRLEKQSS